MNCDFHTHTGFSDDCNIPMDIMIEGAIKKGLKTLAITDHVDPGFPDPNIPFTLDFYNYHKCLLQAQSHYGHQLEILAGLELGIMEGQFPVSKKIVNSFPYDIVIGSFHCLGKNDLYSYDFSDVDGPAMVEDFYSYMYRCLKSFQDYDILGHFSILDRYIGTLYDYGPCEEIIDEILRLMVVGGKGLEINTSNFRYHTGTWLPRGSILKRYRELGGEILTIGSDAHSPDYFQFHFEDAIPFAKSLGFRYYCEFRSRKPEFFTL
ncbi:MAG: histidinol-phosphatase HisJ family protein [Clostridiales bacterium]|nr:histidinol-phosphatase HisJ family protein [Clostridiales bacterium]